MRVVARLLGWTEGQLHTFVVALLLAVWLMWGTLSALQDRPSNTRRAAIPFHRLGGEPAPLSVIAAGYASARLGGSPLPSGTIAAGSDGRGDTRRAFIRLAGEAGVLHLDAVPDPGLTHGEARLRLCPITVVWLPLRDVPLSGGPAYDCRHAVRGVVMNGGRWSFDLGAFPGRTEGDGFALVPGEPVTADGAFQVTFAVGPPPGPT